MKADEGAVLKIGLQLFGATHLAVVLGWCAWLVAMAPEGVDRTWVLAHGPMSVPTRYRRVRELETWRAAIAAAGYDVDEPESPLSVRVAMRALVA